MTICPNRHHHHHHHHRAHTQNQNTSHKKGNKIKSLESLSREREEIRNLAPVQHFVQLYALIVRSIFMAPAFCIEWQYRIIYMFLTYQITAEERKRNSMKGFCNDNLVIVWIYFTFGLTLSVQLCLV